MPHVLVWDIETIPDISGFAAANDLLGKTAAEVRAAMGDKFPKHIYHSIICIGALIAHQDGDHWVVDALGAPHVGERSEEELIASFVDRIAELARRCYSAAGITPLAHEEWKPRGHDLTGLSCGGECR
jgi:predicted PolB exonuclease-like 3'-5' exonuclease